ncbi:MAG: translocation/assembly module TamB domain-containing protein [Armatimonadota bacterium]
MITRRQKLVIGLISYIPVLVLIAWSVFYVIGQYRRVVDNASVLLVEELSRRLDREVKIGSASVTPFGVAVLKNVEIAAEKKIANGRILEVSEARIKYSLRALLLNKKGAQSIASVVVVDPKVYLVRRKDGSLNIQDLLKRPPGPPGVPFEGSVEIRNATLVFTDYLAKTISPPAVNLVTDLQGFMSAADQPVYRFRGSGRGGKGRFQVAKVVGNYDIRSKTIDLDLDATNVSAAYWSRYLGLSRSLDVKGGTLRVIAGIHVNKSTGKSVISLSGAAGISNASVLLPTMTKPVTNVNGIAALKGQNVILSVTGNLAGSKMRATGTVSGFRNPKIDISASSPNADFSILVKAFKLAESVKQLKASGRGPVRGRITGAASSPTIAVTARVPRVMVQGFDARNVNITGTYRKGLLSVSSAEFDWQGARVAASGTISTSGRPNVFITGRATGVDITALQMPPEWNVKGVGRVEFTVTGPISSPNILANVNVAKGKFRGIPVEIARARVSYARGKLRVAALEVTSKVAGRVTARGEISRKGINLSVIGESVNLATVGGILGLKTLSGTGYFAGTIRGTLSAPAFSGTFEAFAAQYGRQKVDYVRLVFTTNMKTATVESGVVRLFPAEFKFSGSATGFGTDRIAFNASGQVERLTVGKLAGLLGRKIDASGTLVGSFDAAGIYLLKPNRGQLPLQNTVASAELKLEDGSAFGYPITDAVARLNLLDNRLEVTEAVLTSQDAKATLGGSVLLDTGAVDLRFDVSGFDLARLHNLIGEYATVGGIARAEGTVTGTLDNPIVVASANVDNLIVNYSKFDVAEVRASYSNGIVESVTASLKKGAQQLSVEAKGYDLETNCLMSATGNIENLRVPELWNTFIASPYLKSESAVQIRQSLAQVPKLTSGVLNGTFSMSGCLASPNGKLRLVASDVGIMSRQIDSIVLDAEASGGIVTLSQLRASAGSTSVAASGRYEIENRQVQLDIAASNLDLSRLRPWLGDRTPGGTMAADFTINGDIGSPSIIGSVEVVKPSFGGLTFDALRASRIEVKEDRIEFADVILAAGSHQAIAQGYVPWSWSSMTIPTTKPIEMVARLKKQDLSVLSSFSPTVDPSGTTGSVEAMLQVTGTLAEPILGGSLTVQNGSVALRNFGNQFNNINVNVSFDGDRIVFNQFSVASSLGGTMSVVPGGYISVGQGKPAEASLLVVANGFSIAEQNALGLKEDVSLQFDAGLSVTGDPLAPLVTNANIGNVPGGITIHDSRVAFVAPEIPSRQPSAALPINPTFNLAIRIGENVVIAPPTMTLTVTGDGSVTGNLEKPDVVLDLTIQEGSLRLAVSRLTVAPGGKLYMRYSPPLNPEIRVDFQASTSVTAMNSLGQRERYVITVAVTGPVSNLEIHLSSTPADLSKEQMLAALGHVSGIFAGGESGLQNELGNILTAVGTSTIFAPVESLFVKEFGFEQFSLEYSLGQPLAIYASRRLFGNLFISYYGVLTSNFTSPNDVAYLLGLGYRFNRNYQFTMFVDNMQNGSFQIQYTQAFR